MVLLGSMLHRSELADILGRAIEDRLEPGDPERLKQIVNLNSWTMRTWSTQFALDMMRTIRGPDVQVRAVRTKGELKDLIVASPYYLTPRIETLIARYRRFPEDFYRETPYEGLIFLHGDPLRYVGSRRIKRVRRVAEKCARRLIDYLFEEIRHRADELAAERARHLNIPKEALVTPPEEMAAEFQHAERRVLKTIRQGQFVATMPQFFIDDVVGLRVLIGPEVAYRVEEYLAAHPRLGVVDEKRFSGNFVGMNRVLRYRVPLEEVVAVPPDETACKVLVERRVAADAGEATRLYREFVATGEEEVRFEILLINFEELMESEIGRSMHEEHILEQREKQEYRGRLARNIEALMAYLFAFALSPKATICRLPIQVGGSYLDDYFDSVMRALFSSTTGTLGLTL